MMPVNKKIGLFLKNHKYKRINILVIILLALIIGSTIITLFIKPAVSTTSDDDIVFINSVSSDDPDPSEGSGIMPLSDELGYDFDKLDPFPFGSYISGATYDENDTLLDSYDDMLIPFKFRIDYILPISDDPFKGGSNRQIIYQLPDDIVIPNWWGIQGGSLKNDIGYYRVYTDETDGKNYILIQFNDVKGVDSDVEGYVTFTACAKKGSEDDKTTDIGFNDKVNLKVDFPSDLSISKNGEYDADNGTLNYIINISSQYGSGEDILLSDIFTAGSQFADLNGLSCTVTKIKNDLYGNAIRENVENVQKTPHTDDNGLVDGFEMILPELSPKNRYEIVYSMPFINDENSNYDVLDNTVNASCENGSFKDVSAKKELAVVSDLKIDKTGAASVDEGIITWTITLQNPNNDPLGGFKIADDMFTADSEIEVYDSFGNKIENAGYLQSITVSHDDGRTEEKLAYIFNDNVGSDVKNLTVKYKTDITDYGTNVKNYAMLYDKDNDEVDPAEGSVYVGALSRYVGKSAASGGYDTDGNNIIRWTVNLYFQTGDFANNTYTDTLMTANEQRPHYMTPEQLGNIVVKGRLYGEWESLNQTLVPDVDYTIIPSYDSTGMVNGFDIAFTGSDLVQSLANVDIYYESIGVVGNMYAGETAEYNNKGSFMDNEVVSTYKYTKSDPLKKYDAKTGSTNVSSYDINTLEKTDNGDFILNWYVIVNEGANYGSEDIVFYDTLPEGMTLIEDSVKGEVLENGNYTAVGYDSWLTDNNGGRELTFGIPYDIHQGRAVKISYSAKLPEEYFFEHKSKNDLSLKLTNTVTDNDGFSASQTQNIYHNAVYKTGGYDGGGDVKFTIDVNPMADDLSSGDTLTVIDRLRHKGQMHYEAEFRNIRVIAVDENGSETELSPSLYKPDYSEEDIPYMTEKYLVCTITLPDNIHLKVECNYNCKYYGDEIVQNVNVENSVELDADIIYNNNYTCQGCDLSKASSAGASTTSTVNLYKIDSDVQDSFDADDCLEGAVFKLYMFEDGEWKRLVDTDTSQSDASFGSNVAGKPVWGDDSSDYVIETSLKTPYRMPELVNGVLYKFVEIKAPENHLIRQEPFYFAVGWYPSLNNCPDDFTLDSLENINLPSKGILGVPNDKKESLSLSVKKTWNDNEPSHEPVKVRLLQSKVPPRKEGEEEKVPETTEAKETHYITVNITDIKNHSFKKNFKVDENSDMKLTISALDAYFDNAGCFKVNNNNDMNYYYTLRNWFGYQSDEFDVKIEYNIGSVKGKITNIDIYFEQAQDYSKYGLEISNCTEIDALPGATEPATEPPDDQPSYNTPQIIIPSLSEKTIQYGDYITLGENGEWSYKWEGLPSTDDNGALYYYYVEELAPEGYIAKYSTNGLNGGEIGITNLKENEIPVLAQTGGMGTRKIMFTGMAMVVTSTAAYFLIDRRKRRSRRH